MAEQDLLTPDFASYPFATAHLPPIMGAMRRVPSDFQVEELPNFEPDDAGAFWAVLIEKSDLTTPVLAGALRDALGLRADDVTWAGLKDRHAVTRQWLTLPRQNTPPPAEWPLPEGARLLNALPLAQKLHEGHLLGNRFRILLREPTGPAADVVAIFLALGREGVPNYFGPQRFGKDGRNAAKGLAFARSRRGKARGFLEKLTMNALQSLAFNAWLARRLPGPSLLAGDIAHKVATGGKFLVPDPASEQARADAFEIVASGPLFGKKYHEAQGEAAALEDEILASLQLTRQDFLSCPGARRPARVLLEDFGVEEAVEGHWLRFTLPRGSYATSVLREVFKGNAPSGEAGGAIDPE